MRVTDGWGNETEGFVSWDGRATILGGGSMDLGDFYRHYRIEPDRRDRERRVTRDRRRICGAARRHGPRRRRDALTTGEMIGFCLGIEFTC
jgi:hypothetical protein